MRMILAAKRDTLRQMNRKAEKDMELADLSTYIM